MVKNKEENPYVLEVKTVDDNAVILSEWGNKDYIIKTKYNDIKFEINGRTSSCGSIQIMNMYIGKYQNNLESGLSLEQRREILEKIKDDNERNHIFFIDCEDGCLEKFFGDLGFTKCWSYFNPNSENTVNMWSLNRKTEDEYYEEQDSDW